jgi:hypothetical protein
MGATIAIAKGHYLDRGWAVYVTEEKRRRCPLNTEYGLADEEALWAALSAWATFQPRKAKLRTDSDFLYYPNEFYHVFEKFWDHIACLDQHPGRRTRRDRQIAPDPGLSRYWEEHGKSVVTVLGGLARG